MTEDGDIRNNNIIHERFLPLEPLIDCKSKLPRTTGLLMRFACKVVGASNGLPFRIWLRDRRLEPLEENIRYPNGSVLGFVCALPAPVRSIRHNLLNLVLRRFLQTQLRLKCSMGRLKSRGLFIQVFDIIQFPESYTMYKCDIFHHHLCSVSFSPSMQSCNPSSTHPSRIIPFSARFSLFTLHTPSSRTHPSRFFIVASSSHTTQEIPLLNILPSLLPHRLPNFFSLPLRRQRPLHTALLVRR